MIETVALIIILLFGIIISFLCAFGIYKPERLMSLVTDVFAKPIGMVLAVGVRVVLGLSLLFAASASLYPGVLHVLGVIALIAAVGILMIGRERIERILQWAGKFSLITFRLWLVFGLLFGLFLVHAVL